MPYVRLDEALLLFDGRILATIAGIRRYRIVVIVRPLRKVIGEFKTRQIGSGIFKVNDNKLLMLVCGLQKR